MSSRNNTGGFKVNLKDKMYSKSEADAIINSANQQIALIIASNQSQTTKDIGIAFYFSLINKTELNTYKEIKPNSIVAKFQAQKENKTQQKRKQALSRKIQMTTTRVVKFTPRKGRDTQFNK
jgi:hypothetical protein